MTSLLAGTVAHGARGGRGVSKSHHRRTSPGLSGTPRYSPELPGNGSHNTSEARGLRFNPRSWQSKYPCPNTLSLVSFAGMTLDKCIVLRIGTLTGCPLSGDKNSTCPLVITSEI